MPRKRVYRKKVHRRRPRRMRGRGFFGDIWEGVKRAVTKPSTWLGAAGFLPTPLAPAFKLGSVISGLAGHGRRRKRRVAHRRRRGGAFGLMPVYRHNLMGGFRMPNSLDPIA